MLTKRAASAALIAGTTLFCSCDSNPTPAAKGPLSQSQKVEAVASTLQACSYDGRPVTAPAAALSGNAPDECLTDVKRIMAFTGLPANFDVVSGPVDNAAAVILLDKGGTPHRVIAFNPQFISAAEQQVGGNPWGPISIMAHEIGHHLSGHTITPGGSRPEIELEADKFSGFVLYKMGAPMNAATQMVLTVGSPHPTMTHPAREERAAAIRQGWMESCQQAGRSDCENAAAATSATPVPVPQPTFAVVRTLPDPGSIPFKYGRFVVDETGKLDPARAKAIDDRLYALAKDVGAEFAILVVDDLHGMSADDFAWAMMRQLRVGKLDVGNGAVAVVAPRQHQAAVAFGPGFAKEAEFSNPKKQLLEWIDAAWPYCDDADGCKQWTDNLANVFSFTLNNVAHTKWTIDYPSLTALMDHYDRLDAERARTHRPFDASVDQSLGNLLRLHGTITSLRAPTGFGQANPNILGGELGYTAVSMTTDDGRPVILYVSPRLARLMPAGQLQVGKDYTLVGRLQTRGDRAGQQASALWLFSYDRV